MYFTEEKITPEIAKEMLSRNMKNRRLSQRRVKQYADDMMNGFWTGSPSPICFDETGVLIDGQHRLSAVIKCGKTINMVVARNVSRDSIIDRGRVRSTGDSLYMRGFVESNMATAEVIALANAFLTAAYGGERASDEQIGEFIHNNEELITKSLSISRTGMKPEMRVCGKCGVRAAVLAALKSGVDSNVLSAFCEAVNTGYSSGPNQSSAITLRNFLMSDSSTRNRGAIAKMMNITQSAIYDFVNETPRRKPYSEGTNMYVEQVKA